LRFANGAHPLLPQGTLTNGALPTAGLLPATDACYVERTQAMTLARAGSRQLLVEGVQYRWTVAPNDEQGGCIIAECANLPARRLVCWVEPGVAVSLGLLRRAILDALAAGWVPTRRGADFILRVPAFADTPSAFYQCPVCDYFTLPRRVAYEICPVCFWAYDELELDRLEHVSRPNHLTLREARDNFRRLGASSLEMRGAVLSEKSRQRYRHAPR
jgi:hypothetical protein